MALFGISKADLVNIEAQIKLIKADIEILRDSIKSMKGYMYANKLKGTVELEEKSLNTGLPAW